MPFPESLARHEPCRDCALHRPTGLGCAVVERGGGVPLDGFIARRVCFLKDHLLAFCRRYLGQRPRTLGDAEDLMHDTLTRLLRDPQVRGGGFARGLGAFLGYLRQTAVRCAITAERRERGRLRCGNCVHYGAWSGRCFAAGHAWTHREMPNEQNPRELDPACQRFKPRKDGVALGDEAIARLAGTARATDPQRGRDESEALHQALADLALVHTRAALVVRALFLDGKTYDDLASIGYSVRTLKRDRAYALAFLARRLGGAGRCDGESDAGGARHAAQRGAMGVDSLAREAGSGRSGADG